MEPQFRNQGTDVEHVFITPDVFAKTRQSVETERRFWHLVDTCIEDSALAPLSEEWRRNANAQVAPHLLKLKNAYNAFWQVGVIQGKRCWGSEKREGGPWIWSRGANVNFLCVKNYFFPVAQNLQNWGRARARPLGPPLREL